MVAAESGGELQFVSPGGNGGDALIDVGFFHLAESYGIPYRLTEPADVDRSGVVVLSGGGGLVAEHPTSRIIMLIEMFREESRRLVILPQTITGHEELLASLRSNVTIFARESRTANHLSDHVRGGATYGVDHDMAFNVDVGKLFRARASLPKVSTVKDVARVGLCGFAGVRGLTRPSIDALRKDSEARGVTSGRPLRNDISKITAFRGGGEKHRKATARLFLKLLDRYKRVTTDRLHVGIGAILLGKNVSLINNSNGKVHEVYKYSAAQLENVKIIDA